MSRSRFFTITLIVFGVTLILVTASLAASTISQRDFGQTARRRRMQRRIDALRDHYIVCAYGRVGRAVARQLEEEGRVHGRPVDVADGDGLHLDRAQRRAE